MVGLVGAGSNGHAGLPGIACTTLSKVQTSTLCPWVLAGLGGVNHREARQVAVTSEKLTPHTTLPAKLACTAPSEPAPPDCAIAPELRQGRAGQGHPMQEGRSHRRAGAVRLPGPPCRAHTLASLVQQRPSVSVRALQRRPTPPRARRGGRQRAPTSCSLACRSLQLALPTACGCM